MFGSLGEQIRNEEHQMQMNKFYEGVVSGYLEEIDYTKSAIANRVLTGIRNGKNDDDIVDQLLQDEYIDWEPWLTIGEPYKFYIVISYYRWHDHFKQRGELINKLTGKRQ